MKTPSKRQTVTYIVRVWAEYLHERPPLWRGVIERVGGDQQTHFSHLEEITDFVREQTIIQISVDPKKGKLSTDFADDPDFLI